MIPSPAPTRVLTIGCLYTQSVALPFLSEETLPIVGEETLHLFWRYLFTYKYNSYDYSNVDKTGFDHGNTAVSIISKGKASCDCATGWEFGNLTWFTKGDVSISSPVASTDNPGACCNFFVEPTCGMAPFGRSLWCPVNLTTCTFTSGDVDPKNTAVLVQDFLFTLPDTAETRPLISRGLSSWSFCVSSFSDFLTMEGKPQPSCGGRHAISCA